MSKPPYDISQKPLRFLLQLVIVVAVALVATNFASQAAFEELAPRSATESDYWMTEATTPEATTTRSLTQKSTPSENISTTDITETTAPRVDASAFLVGDITSGEILAAKNLNVPLPIASISKLMTALVASETIEEDEVVTVSRQAVSTYGHAGGLSAGEALTLETMYFPLLLESSNDAAAAIAEHIGRRSFLNLMNRKALALRMGATRFADSSGLSANNISSAHDLFRLSKYIYDKKPFIFDITTRSIETVPQSYSDGLRNFSNNNPMRGQSRFVGGKNGYTDEARHTLLSLFSVPESGENRTIMIVVLGSETHELDTRRLLSWVLER